MKKVVAFILLLASLPVFAQGVGVGIKAGANFANVDVDDVDANPITSFHAGGYVNVNFSEKFGVTPEVLWTGLGSEIGKVRFVSNYVSVPIMLRYNILPLISIEAGPQFGFLINAEMDDVDYKDDMKSTDFGIGARLVVKVLRFNGGVRYVAGLTDVSDEDDFTLKNRTWQVYLGWIIFEAN